MKIADSWVSTCIRLCSLVVFITGLFGVQPHSVTAQTSALDVAQIDAFVRATVQRHGIPGLALGIVDGNQIAYLQGYGKADQTGRPITPQTPFVLASASKPLTALAIMQLVESGQVVLNAPVQTYLATFRVADAVSSRQITVRHLLNHTSGIPEQGCQSNRLGAKTLEQFVTALQSIQLEAPVGTRHLYCSGNYNILGRIIEVVSGQSFAAYMQQHIFTPLAMHHSFTDEQAALQNGLAQGYWWLFGLAMPTDYPYEVAQMPSGFLIASAEDMTHFLVAQLNGGRFADRSILSPTGIAALQAPGVASGDGTYGLGWRTGMIGGMPTISHPGDHTNVHTFLLMEPTHQRGAVLLINSQNALAQFGAFKEIEAGVARLLAGQEPAPPAALSLPTLYLIIDVVLGTFLLLALWPLLRMGRWHKQLQRQQNTGAMRRWPVILRIAKEFAGPLLLLSGARLLLAALGAQSWSEGIMLFPDLIVWIWVVALLLLLRSALHSFLLYRALHVSEPA